MASRQEVLQIVAEQQDDQVREVSSLYGDSCFSAGGALLRKAANDLSDVELVSILFGIDKPDAQTWLYQAGGLRPLVESSALGKALIELSSRYLFEKCKRGDVLSDPDAVRCYLTQQLRDRESEVFACVFLDNRHRVISYEELFHGTIDGASVHPREVVKRALHHNAAALILAHNHPSGIAEPSTADERITNRLQEAMALIDVRVLDHFVIGETVTSFCELGLL